jgi:DNA polymerase-3 subunit epsilon
MLLFGIDLETTGLNPESDLILEVAYVLKSVGDPRPWVMRSEYVYEESYGTNFIPDESFNVHAIHSDTVRKFGVGLEKIYADICHILGFHNVVFIVGHNSRSFDIPFFVTKLKQLGLDGTMLEKYKNIDTRYDINYPASIKTRTLSHLAAEHGFLNPFPHSALPDVMTTFKILECYDIKKVAESAVSPSMVVRMVVPHPREDNGKGKDFAKSKGFYWNAEHGGRH